MRVFPWKHSISTCHNDRKVNVRIYTQNHENKSAYVDNSILKDTAGHSTGEKEKLKTLDGIVRIILLNSSFD